MKDEETSDTQLSQEDMVDDRIQTEENRNGPNDACNPDKQTSEAEVIFCTIKGTDQVEVICNGNCSQANSSIQFYT